MEFIGALILLVLAVPVIAIVALVKAVGASDRILRLERRIGELESRLAEAIRATPARPPEEAPEQPSQRAAEPEPLPETVATPIAEQEPPTAPEPEPEPVSEPTPQTSTPASSFPAPSFEERFGTRWVVWIGGLALALGGIFLVRHTIEAGLLGPGMRVLLGGVLAAAMIAAGEWARRQENLSGLRGLPTAHIPSILTAAGTVTAFAAVYVAHGLYGFIGPATAFILLGIVALSTLAAALLHGPALAGLGVVGSYVTPLLVSSDEPSYWALYLFLAVVTAAAFGLARLRHWRWLMLTAAAFGLFWTLPGLDVVGVLNLEAHLFHVVAGFVLAAVLVVAGLFLGPPSERGRIDLNSSAALAIYLLGALLVTLASRHDGLALTAFSVLMFATVAIAWRTDAAAPAVPFAAAMAVLVILRWTFAPQLEGLLAPPGLSGAPIVPAIDTTPHLLLAAFFAALFGAMGFIAQNRATSAPVSILWSATGVATPIALLIALYAAISGFERSIPFAGLALLLAALHAVAVETLSKRPPAPGSATIVALHATGAVAALALALTFALERGWLTVALALMVPGIAWVQQHRPLPMLRWLAAILAAIVAIRIGWEPRIVGYDVGSTPIFNWLLYGYGVPALAFWFAGHLLRKRADDPPTRTVESAAILFTVLTVVLQIRHLITGDIDSTQGMLAEVGPQVCAGLAMALGLEHVRRRTQSVIHDIGALAIAGLTLVAIVFGLGFVANPSLTGEPVGGLVFNLVLIGYGIPAVLAAILVLHTRGVRPQRYRLGAAVVALVLAFGWITLEVMRLYRGPVLAFGPATDAEIYTVSAAWLAFGVALLLFGSWWPSQHARLASAAIVILTVAKVFFVDMADLTGVWRALSFIGLGLVLVGIGWLYQRLLFPPRGTAAPPA